MSRRRPRCLMSMIEHQSPAEEYREIAGRFTELVEGRGRRRDVGPPVARRGVDGARRGPPPRRVVPRVPRGRRGHRAAPGPGRRRRPARGVATMSDGVQAVLDDPAARTGCCRTLTSARCRCREAISRFFTADVFMHTWDLARATGQDETLDRRCAGMLRACSRSTRCCAPAASTGRGSRCRTTPTPDEADGVHRPGSPLTVRTASGRSPGTRHAPPNRPIARRERWPARCASAGRTPRRCSSSRTCRRRS